MLTLKAHTDDKNDFILMRLQSFANVKLAPTNKIKLFRRYNIRQVSETTLSFVSNELLFLNTIFILNMPVYTIGKY